MVVTMNLNIMKRYSKYIKVLSTLTIMFTILAIVSIKCNYPMIGVITFTSAFICLFVSLMAPDHEKYNH